VLAGKQLDLQERRKFMTRIIIEIEGGLVQAIWSTDKTVKAEILDRDLPETDEDCDSCIREIAKHEADVRNLNMVDIS
jgi:hypothetical protein